MNSHIVTLPIAGIDWRRWLLRGGLALASAMLIANFGKLLYSGALALSYRYELDYGEGIVWQQMRNIAGGQGYSPLRVFPAIVYHYPPVYYLTTLATASLGGLDQLIAGRLVSLVSTIASMILAALLSASATARDEDRTVRLASAAFAGLSLASAPTILNWSAVMRVDMLACALQLAGLMLAVRAVKRPSLVPLAAIAFVLAVYTKQTSIAGPLAAFAGLWFVRPRSALMLAAWCAGLGLATLAAMSLMTGSGFLRHVVLYNINRVDLGKWRMFTLLVLSQIVFIGIAMFGAIAGVRRLWPADGESFRKRIAAEPANAALLIVLLYLLAKAAMLPMILKSGASDNYMIEWIAGVAIVGGIGVAPVLRVARGGNAWPAATLIALVTIGVPLQAYRLPLGNSALYAGQDEAEMARVVATIRASAKPVITDQMVLLIRAGKPVLWEPAITAELAHGGLYDEQAFVAKIDARQFGFFLTLGDRGDYLFDSRYNSAVADAIAHAYPRTVRRGDLVYHFPAR